MTTAAILQYPAKLATNVTEYPHIITFNAVTRNTTGQGGITSAGRVAMYMPADALKASYNQTFGDVDAGAAGIALAGVTGPAAAGAVNAIEGSIRGATNFSLDQIGEGLGQAFNAVSGNLGGIDIKGALAQAAIQEQTNRLSGAAGAARDLIMKKAGKIMNPHKAILYQGPGGFRVFNYTFAMSPESQSEAETIAKIVHYFKYHMHPGVPGVSGRDSQDNPIATSSGGNINSSITLTYPEEFEIKLLPRGSGDAGTRGKSLASSVKPLFRIERCVLESLSVDYATSGGPAFIVDGITTPATTTLSLQFKETVLMTKQKIEVGF